MNLLLPIMIIATGCFIGFYIKRQYVKRQSALKLYIKAFDTILLHIKSENLSTRSLIKLIALDTQFKECTIFIQCYKLLEQTDDFPQAYIHAVLDCKGTTSLLPQDIEIIKDLGNVLGAYDLGELIAQLELILHKLEKELEKAIIETNSQGKVYQTLASLGAVAIAIIII